MLNIDLRIKPCRHSCLIFIIPKLFSYDTRDLKRVIKLTDFFHRLLICVYGRTHAQISSIFVLYSNPPLITKFRPICIISQAFTAFVTFPIPSADLINVLLTHSSTSLITRDVKPDQVLTATQSPIPPTTGHIFLLYPGFEPS